VSRLRRVLLACAGVLTPVVAFGLYWFQPWKLFTNTTVHDSLPAVVTQSAPPARPVPPTPTSTAPAGSSSAPPPAQDVVLARGELISHEHSTSGTVSLVELADGKHVLAIEDLDTSEGPDVEIWLTDQRVTKDGWHVFDDGWHTSLGDLKGNLGDQVYRIPESVDLDRVASVSVWCARFDVSFGAAELARS